ncbi:MAG: DUF6449 domain-containing protein [Clostridia bacterium]
MTIKTFFNKGIYKSTVKRFSIGSVLYFLLMFMCTGLMIMLAYDSYIYQSWDNDLILTDGFLIPSMLMGFVVPTIVALLVYRFVHSKKASVFAHSMPVTRMQNYISTLAAAFTLMGLPIILNGIVLILMSLTKYHTLFSVESAFVWVGVNLLTVFIMFAFSTFVAMITGNSFALAALNLFIYIALPVVGSVVDVLLDQFLYGSAQSTSIANIAIEMNPVATLADFSSYISYGGNFKDFSSIIAFTVVAALMYVVNYFIYKKRNVETSEDVAAFKVLNPIFKYAVTFVGTLSVFALFSSLISEKPIMVFIVVAVLGAVIYFGSEMLLRKQIKVWHTYKGYLVFGVIFFLMVGFIMFTSVFGYETYVPDVNDIETAAIYNYYYQDVEPFTDSEKINEYIVNVHSELTGKENIMLFNYDTRGWYQDADTRIHIVYELKNGKTVARRYPISNEKRDKIMEKLYKYPEYKYACEEVFRNDVNDVVAVSVNGYEIEGTIAELNEFLECAKRDVEKLSYTDLHGDSDESYIGGCYIECTCGGKDVYTCSIHFDLTTKYKETVMWLEEKGYDIKSFEEKVLG